MSPSRTSFSTIALYAGAAVVASVLGAGSYALIASSEPERTTAAPATAPAGVVGPEILAALRPLAAEIGDAHKLEMAEAPKPFEQIAFSDAEGRAASTEDFRGKIVLLNFWATWCAPCLEEMPALDALQERLGGEDFTVLAINIDRGAPTRPLRWLEDNDIDSLAFFQDGSMQSARAAKVVGMPTTVLLDREGRELGRLLGAAEWDGAPAVSLIQSLMAGAPPNS